jgi:trigger factor
LTDISERIPALKIDKQLIDNHHALLTVEYEKSEFEQFRKRAARKLAQRVKIPGFRPGKAPYQVILRYVGDAALAEEAVEILIDDQYPKILEEAQIVPSAQGRLKEIKGLDPLTLEVEVPLKPEVELGDYRSIRSDYKLKDTTEAEIDEVLQRLQESQAIIEPVDRLVQEGDVVTIKLSGKRFGQTSETDTRVFEERSTPITIRRIEQDTADEWPFPGFSQHLIGKSRGDDGTVEYRFPEDYRVDSMRAVTVNYQFSIEEVKSRTLPEVNDELAQTIGEYNTLDELRSAIRADLEKHAEQEYNADYDDQVVTKIVEISNFKYPSEMIDNEIDAVISRLDLRLKNQGMDLDLYMKSRQIDMDALREEARPTAEMRLKRSIVLSEVADKEDIQVGSDEIEAETMRTLNQFSQVMPEKEMRQFTTREGSNNLVGNIAMDLMVNKTLERLRAFARGMDPDALVSTNTGESETDTIVPAGEEPDADGQTITPVDVTPDHTENN